MLFALLLALGAWTNVQAAGFAVEEGVTAQEIFFRYYPSQGYVQIKEYNLSLLSDTDAMPEINALVAEATYCDTHFNFEFIESVEERIFKDRDAVTAECNMFVRNDDVPTIMQDLLSGILDRPVGAGFREKELTVSFDGEDIQLAENNSEGMYGKGKRRSIFWKEDLDYFEAIISVVGWDAERRSLSTVMTQDLSSPELTTEEVSARRKEIRQTKP